MFREPPIVKDPPAKSWRRRGFDRVCGRTPRDHIAKESTFLERAKLRLIALRQLQLCGPLKQQRMIVRLWGDEAGSAMSARDGVNPGRHPRSSGESDGALYPAVDPRMSLFAIEAVKATRIDRKRRTPYLRVAPSLDVRSSTGATLGVIVPNQSMFDKQRALHAVHDQRMSGSLEPAVEIRQVHVRAVREHPMSMRDHL